MIATKIDWEAYDSSKWKKPWVGKILEWRTDCLPSLEWGMYIGNDNGGILEVDCEEGDILRYGQKSVDEEEKNYYWAMADGLGGITPLPNGGAAWRKWKNISYGSKRLEVPSEDSFLACIRNPESSNVKKVSFSGKRKLNSIPIASGVISARRPFTVYQDAEEEIVVVYKTTSNLTFKRINPRGKDSTIIIPEKESAITAIEVPKEGLKDFLEGGMRIL